MTWFSLFASFHFCKRKHVTSNCLSFYCGSTNLQFFTVTTMFTCLDAWDEYLVNQTWKFLFFLTIILPIRDAKKSASCTEKHSIFRRYSSKRNSIWRWRFWSINSTTSMGSRFEWCRILYFLLYDSLTKFWFCASRKMYWRTKPKHNARLLLALLLVVLCFFLSLFVPY